MGTKPKSPSKTSSTAKTSKPKMPSKLKKLIIAEKPSVAADLAKILGSFTKKRDYYENDDYVISYSVGHLLRLAMPADLGQKDWRFESLPIIPETFDLLPIDAVQDRLNTLVKLIRRKDIDEVINACDAGREGELIFREIIAYSGVSKKLRRLWLQSMTPEAIRDGFLHLREDESMKGLSDAALCRSESDWLVGINTTRALTAFNSKNGGFFLTPAGRVQTPTLSILVQREKERLSFVSRPYYEVVISLRSKAGSFESKWFDPNPSSDAPEKKPSRIWDIARAEAIQKKVLQKETVFEEVKKPSKQTAPLLFDLTSLQRECSNRFGFSANRTLQIAQSLYEQHKLITYPRTDSKFLPEDYLSIVNSTLNNLQKTAYKPFAEQILRERWVVPNKRIFDNTKVSDHFAIIPTGQIPSELEDAAEKLFDQICKRFLAIFFPVAEYELTTRTTYIENEFFKTEGKVLKVAGWKEVYGKDQDGESELPPLKEKEPVLVTGAEILHEETKSTPRYTEATLLSAMEGADKLVEDEELKEALKERGLGTPATRASIIEGLISEGYVVREGRDLVPTAKGIELYEMLMTLKVDVITSPEMTGEWEHLLKQIEMEKYTRQKFMKDIKELTREIVSKIKNFKEDAVSKGLGFLDPVDGSEICETLKAYVSKQGRFVCKKIIGNRKVSPEELKELLTKGFIGPLTGFLSKQKKPFTAGLKFENGKVELQFDSKETDPDYFKKLPQIGKLKDGSAVYEDTMAFVTDNPKSKFRIPKSLLGKTITSEQMAKMVNEGKSDLIQGFRSKKGRLFSAFLSLDAKGNIVFEFATKRQVAASKSTK